MKIYTAGYNAWSFYEFKTKVEELGNILICDIRYSPWSFNPFWTKRHLKKSFKNNYIHLKSLGNANYKKDRPIEILDIDKGSKKLLGKVDGDFLLLCSCEDVGKCHRKVVADILQSMLENTTSCEIIHLKDEEQWTILNV